MHIKRFTFGTIESLRKSRGKASLEVKGADSETRVAWIGAALKHFRYKDLSRDDKGVVRLYLQNSTGYSRAQIARHIAARTIARKSRLFIPNLRAPTKYESFAVASLAVLLLLSGSGDGNMNASVLKVLNAERSDFTRDDLHLAALKADEDDSRVAEIYTTYTNADGEVVAYPLLVSSSTTVAASDGRPLSETIVSWSLEDMLRRVAQRREDRLRALGNDDDGRTAIRPDVLISKEAFPAYPLPEGQHAAAPSVWDVPAGGKEGQILMIQNGKIVWHDFPYLDEIRNAPAHGGEGTRRAGGMRSGGGTNTNVVNNNTTNNTTTVVAEPSGWTDGAGVVYLTTITDMVGIGTNDPETALEVAGTISGSSLSVSGTISGASLFISGSVQGAGLADCDAAASKLIYDAATGTFSCAIDQTVGTGLDINTGDERYVNTSGDTMTGALTINVTGGSNGTVGLNVLNTISGAVVHAQKSLTTSGTLVFEGAASGASLYVASSFNGAGLVDCDIAGTSKLLWDASTGRFSCGTDANTDTNTTYTAGRGLTLNGTSFSTNDILTGALISFTAVNGTTVHANNTLSSSGTLVFEGAASGSSLYIATSLQGAGLTDCDAAGQTLNWDASTGRFTCGTDADTDTNTTYTAGRGLTLNGTSFSTNDILTGALIRFTTISGSTVYARNGLSTSGTLVFEGAASGSSLYIATSLNGAGLVDCDIAGTSKLLWDATTGRFSCGTDTDTDTNTTYTAGRGLGLNGTSFSLNSTITGALVRFNTVSGSTVYARNGLSTSGTLVWEGTASGSSLWVSTFAGAGLTDCDLSTNVVRWDAATNRFSCGTVSASSSVSTGSVLTIGDARYVRKAGDTMTGALAINISNGVQGTVGLNVINTISGAVIRAQKTLASSGTLVFEGAASGASLYVATSFQGAGLVDCDIAGTSKLLWDSATGRFSCGTDQSGGGASAPEVGTLSFSGAVQRISDSRYVNTSGDTMTGQLVINVTGGNNGTVALNVLNTISGAVIRAQKTLASSGTLVWEGAASGASLWVSTLEGAGLTDCDAAGQTLNWDATTKRFICGVDDSAGSGLDQNSADTRYVNTSGDTMTGALTINVTGGSNTTLGLNVLNTISGAVIRAQKTLASSGTIVSESGAYIDGNTLVVQAGNNRVGIGTATPGANLEVNGADARMRLVDTDANGQIGLNFHNSANEVAAILVDTNTNTLTLESRMSGGGAVGGSITLLNTGNLGLDTATPGSRLSVSGAAIIGNNIGSGVAKAQLDVKGSMSGTVLTLSNMRTCTLKTSATGAVICGTDIDTDTNTTYTAGRGLTLNGTSFSTNDILTGSLIRFSTVSGSTVYARNSLSTSGTLVFEGAASGSSLYIATSLQGAGLTDCDAASQALKWDASTGRFSCGAVSTNSFGTGNVLTLGDARYVNTAGDTMTGTLAINPASGLALNARGTISGSLITQNGAGNNYFMGNLGIGTVSPATQLDVQGDGTTSGNAFIVRNSAGTKTFFVQDNGRIGVNTSSAVTSLDIAIADDNTGISGGPGTLSFITNGSTDVTIIDSGNVGIGTTGPKAKLDVAGSMSGTVLTLSNMRTCTLKTSATGAVICGTDIDTDTNTTYTAGRGLTLNGTSFSTNDILTGSLIRFTTISGSTVYARNSLSTSGSLTWEGAASGASLWVSTLEGAGLTDCDAAGQTLNWDATTKRFVCGVDESAASGLDQNSGDARYVNTSGDTMTGALTINVTGGNNNTIGLNVLNTISGAVIRAQKTLASSGTLVFEGAASGSSLYIATSLQGAGLTDCDLATQTLAWDASTGRFSCGTDSDTTYTAGQGLTLNGTALSLNSTITGSLIRFTTVSGSTVNARNTLASSGTLVFEGAASGSSLYIATSLQGAGLVDCDIAGTSKLLWDSATGRFSCGTDTDTDTNTQFSNTGALRAAFDARYVNVAGDTMTGALAISVTGGNNNTLALNVLNTISGAVIRAQKTLASSGTLVWEGAASGSSLYIASSLQGAGLVDCDIAGTSKLLWDASTGRFSCGSDADTNTTYTAGRGLTLNGTTFSTNDILTGSLIRFSTVSGSTVYAKNTLASSGTLVWEGAASGASLYVASSLQGAGLVDCDIAGTSKLLWDSSTGRFSCGTDTDTNTQFSNTGALRAAFDARYVNTNGDTMTGALTINVTGGNNSTLGLNVINTISGAVIRAQKSLNSSGTLVFEGAASGSSLYIATSLQGAGLTDCDLATQTLAWDSSTGRFSCGTDSDTTYTAGQGLTLTATSFRVADSISGSLLEFQTVSGSTVYGSKSVRSSGSLVWEGAATGATLYVATSINGAGLVDCDIAGTSKLLWDASTGRFSCGTDTDTNTQFSNTGALRASFDSRYVNTSGDTMTGALTINVTGGNNATLGLNVLNTISGAVIRAQKSLNSSGTLVFEGAASGSSLYIATSINGAGLTDCDAASSTLRWDASTGRFSCGTVSAGSSFGTGNVLTIGDSRYVRRSGGTMTGALTINVTGGNNNTIGLNVLNTISGAVIRAQKTLASSGTLVWEGAASGSSLYIASSINGAGLTDCDAAFSTLRWDATTGRFSCGLISAGSSSFGTGNVLTIGDSRYLRRSGGTMTGALTINVTGGNNNTIGLNVLNTISGAVIRAQKTLASSGTLVWEGAASGASLYVASSFQGAGLVDCDIAGTSKLLWDATTGRFSCGTDQGGGSGLDQTAADARYVNVAGDTMTGALIIRSSLAGSGALSVVQNVEFATGAYIYSSGTVLALDSYSLNGGNKHILFGYRGQFDTNLYRNGTGSLKTDGSLTWLGTGSGNRLSVGRVTSNLIPSLTNTYDLGSSTLRWRDLYLSGGTLRIGAAGNEAQLKYNTSNQRFGLNISGKPTNELTIASGGLLGINTNNPTAALTVSGSTPEIRLGNSQYYARIAQTSNGFTMYNNISGSSTPYAIEVDGTADRVSIAGSTTYVNSNSAFSFAAWVWLDDYGNSYPLMATLKTNGSTGYDIGFSNQAGAYEGIWFGSQSTFTGFRTTGGTPSLNAWHHVVITYNGNGPTTAGNYTAYLDGSSQSITTNSGHGARDNTTNIGGGLGSGSPTLEWDGKIDDVRIYSSVLSSGDVATMYASGAGSQEEVGIPVSWWKFDEGTGTTAADSGTAGATGTLQQNTTWVTGKAQNGAGGVNELELIGSVTSAVSGEQGLLRLGDDDGGTRMQGKTLYFYTGGAERARLTASGFLALGTTTAGSRLTVSGSVLINNLGNIGTGAADAGVALEIVGVMSGRTIKAGSLLASSGGIVFEGVGSGSSLTLAGGNISWSRSGSIVYNEFGNNVDVRMEGDTNQSLFFLDASADFIGIGKNNPKARLDVLGVMSGTSLVVSRGSFFSGSGITFSITGATVFNEQSRNVDFRIEGDANANLFFLDASADFVGIAKNNPRATLDVGGTMSGNSLVVSRNAFFSGSGITFSSTGSVVFNEQSRNVDFRIEGDANASLFFLDASADGIGIGKNNPKAMLDVLGTMSGNSLVVSRNAFFSGSGITFSSTGSVVFNEQSRNVDFRIEGDADGSLFFLDASSDRIGIGTSAPKAKFDVVGTISGSYLYASNGLNSSGILVIKSLAKTGSGAAAFIGAEFQTGAYIYGSGAAALALETYSKNGNIAPHILFGYRGSFDTKITRTATGSLRFQSNTGVLMNLDTERSDATGNVFQIFSDVSTDENRVFRIQANGATFSDAAYASSGADYAEWFFSTDKLKAGEVVCIDVTRNNAVKRCGRNADGNVMGIVSTNPAFVGNTITGADGIMPPGYYLIGLIGQVPTFVNNEGGEIRPGDALTASSIAGVARKAAAGESTVGVALEAMNGAKGTINVLISRRNQSMTVEAVEDKVLKTIAAMEIEDEVEVMISGALGDLNVDQQISDEVTRQLAGMQSQQAMITAIQNEVNMLKAELTALKNAQTTVDGTQSTVSGAFVGGHLAASSAEIDGTLVTGSDARVGGDLTVDGSLTASSLFVPNGMNIQGGIVMQGMLDTTELRVAQNAVVDGAMTINGSLTLGSGAYLDFGSGALSIGDLIVHNSLFVMGDITIEGLAMFLGDLEIKGELIVSDKHAGYAMIPAGGTGVTIHFGSGYVKTPVVTATPNGRVDSAWWLSVATQTGFSINVAEPVVQDTLFSWIALSTGNPITTFVLKNADDAMIFPLDTNNVPVSSSAEWNACIRNIPMMDENGQPMSCARYHDAYTWTHPDLNISFIWNTSLNPAFLKVPDGYVPTVTENADNVVDGIDPELEEVIEDEVDTGTGAVIVEPETETGTTIIEEESSSSAAASSEATSSAPVTEEPVIETPVEETPVEEPVMEEPVVEEPIVEPSTETAGE